MILVVFGVLGYAASQGIVYRKKCYTKTVINEYSRMSSQFGISICF